MQSVDFQCNYFLCKKNIRFYLLFSFLCLSLRLLKYHIMKLKPKEIKKLKIYLALQGSGSRKKLAEKLGLQMSNLSAYISKGQFPDKYVPMINEILK